VGRLIEEPQILAALLEPNSLNKRCASPPAPTLCTRRCICCCVAAITCIGEKIIESIDTSFV